LDIPKGIKNDDESEIACVLRETYEEIGIKIYNDEIQYVGTYPYTREKNLILFRYKEQFDAEDIHLFHCSSYFEREGNSYPEMIGFEWVSKDDIPYRFYKALLPILMEQY
jgi:8-oxo-dGTP pyrophosphatase MutT (NUDIX family)